MNTCKDYRVRRELNKPRHPSNRLTPEECRTLQTMRWTFGRNWKAAVRREWDTDESQQLRSIRNKIGPSGLAKIKIDLVTLN